MFNRFSKQVCFIIKDQIIRYIVSTQPTIEGTLEFGEQILEPGIIEDGKIINMAALQTVVNELVSRKKWKNKRLLFCVPDSSVAMREQLVPKELSKDEIKSFLQIELNNSIRLPFANPVIDFATLGEENNHIKILLFAYPRDRIASYKTLFTKAGLKPIVADLTSLSLYRFYREIGKDTEQDHLLSVQWNMDAIILTSFHQNAPLFTRHVKISLDVEKWKWNEEEKLHKWTGEQQEIEESIEQHLITLDRFIDFYQYSVRNGMDEINKILLTGDFPYLMNAETQMKNRYNLEIDTLNYLEEQVAFPLKFSELVGLSIKKQKL